MDWQLRRVPFKFQLSDWTLASVSLPLQVTSMPLGAVTDPVVSPTLPAEMLDLGSQGYLIRAMPMAPGQPVFRSLGEFVCYVPLQYQHCYVDLGQSFNDYKAKFSSKSRSTITRKVKRWADHCGGRVDWKAFSKADEMDEFFALARAVSATTYQERLLDAGLPESPEFLADMKRRAALDQARGFILFDRERPVSYLFCPVHDDVLIYAYLGYDPSYLKLSVGTVLQWLALEHLFAERRFRYFDFTEGQSDHKRLFATHVISCANLYFVRRTAGNLLLLHAHQRFARLSGWLGGMLEGWGLKKRIKRLLRFGR